MNIKKTILIVISMLITGFSIGFFTAGRMSKSRIDRHRAMIENPALEKDFLAENIGLTPEQENQLLPIMDSMLGIQRILRTEHHDMMKSERKKMFKVLSPQLTAVQRQNIQQFNRMRNLPGPPHR